MSKKQQRESGSAKRPRPHYGQLQQIIVGLSEGVILIGKDRRIIWANDAALAMHGVDRAGGLGKTAAEYRRRFELHYRNFHALERDQYPLDRLVAGERFEALAVTVTRIGDPDRSWVHSVRGLLVAGPTGETECMALI